MQILITGSTGLVGSALVPALNDGGDRVTRLVRSKSDDDSDTIFWDPKSETLDTAALEGVDAVVHLAGENIAAARWSKAQKERIRASRVNGTRLLSKTLALLERRPKVLISASAVGYYGDRGDEILDEQSEAGTGFLADVCRQWEASTEAAAEKGIRVVLLRFGMILSPRGGALATMLTPFRLSLGGCIGSGQQYYSWITLDDAVGSIRHTLATEDLEGPVGAVTPHPVTNREFTKTLGRVLRRPTVFPMPAPVARLAFGEMADALLMASARVQPTRLSASGYAFRYPELEGALRHLLAKQQQPNATA